MNNNSSNSPPSLNANTAATAAAGSGSGSTTPFDFDPSTLPSPERLVMAVMESCPGKTAMSGVMGMGLGMAFGTFMSSVDWNVNNDAYLKMSTKDQLKYTLKDMGRKSWGTGKNFGMVGAIFAGTECVIEGYRAKNDMWNGATAGCLTGGALAYRAGGKAMFLGCATFSAFSSAIDYYMRHSDWS